MPEMCDLVISILFSVLNYAARKLLEVTEQWRTSDTSNMIIVLILYFVSIQCVSLQGGLNIWVPKLLFIILTCVCLCYLCIQYTYTLQH